MSVRSDNVAFNWQDPFLMEEQLSEEERMVRDPPELMLIGVTYPEFIVALADGTLVHRQRCVVLGFDNVLHAAFPCAGS